MIYLKDHPSVKLSNIISQHCSPRSCPATSLQALSLMNYLNISGITHDINIQTFCNICCQLLLSPSLSHTLHSCSYFGDDLYSCGIRLVRACAHSCNVPGMPSEVRLDRSLFPHSQTGLLADDFFFSPVFASHTVLKLA